MTGFYIRATLVINGLKMRYDYFIFRRKRSKNDAKQSKSIVDKIINSFLDAMAEEFPRKHFRLRTSESRFKNIHFTI